MSCTYYQHDPDYFLELCAPIFLQHHPYLGNLWLELMKHEKLQYQEISNTTIKIQTEYCLSYGAFVLLHTIYYSINHHCMEL